MMLSKNIESQPKLLSPNEVCSYLNIGRNTMYRLLQSGMIPAFRIGNRWKIPESSITKFIDDQIETGKECPYV